MQNLVLKYLQNIFHLDEDDGNFLSLMMDGWAALLEL
jgi:hypothetical protein